MSALSSNEAAPRRSPIARAIYALDSLLRKREQVFEYTDDPKCLFRAQWIEAEYDVMLVDGTEIHAGDPLIVLHLWNEQVPSLGHEGASVGWAASAARHIRGSFVELERYLAAQPRQAKAICAESALTLVEGIERIATRLGFERLANPPPPRGGLRRLGENILVLLLMLATNPGSARLKIVAEAHEPIYLSRRNLQRLCLDRSGIRSATG